jgi:hypothetical protein
MRLASIVPLAPMLGAWPGMCYNAFSCELSEKPDDMMESSWLLRQVRIRMTVQTYLPEETMVQRGVKALVKSLGPIEAARFLNLPRQRLLDYVQWHRQWQTSLDQKSFFDTVFGPDNLVD